MSLSAGDPHLDDYNFILVTPHKLSFTWPNNTPEAAIRLGRSRPSSHSIHLKLIATIATKLLGNAA